MRETFAFEDVLNALIRLEERGFRLYSAAAKAATGPVVAALLKRLAAAESRHKRLFEAMKRRETARAGAEPEDTEPDYREYLDVLLDASIPGPALQGKPLDDGTVLREALALEKETILFLMEAERTLTGEATQAKLRRVADEERGHIRAISAAARKLGIEGTT